MDIVFLKDNGSISSLYPVTRTFGNDIISCEETVEDFGVRTMNAEVKYRSDILECKYMYYREPNNDLINQNYRRGKYSPNGLYQSRKIIRLFAITRAEINANGNIDLEGLDFYFYMLNFTRPLIKTYEPYSMTDFRFQFIQSPFTPMIPVDMQTERLLESIEFTVDKTLLAHLEEVLDLSYFYLEPIIYPELQNDVLGNSYWNLIHNIHVYRPGNVNEYWQPTTFILQPHINCGRPIITKEMYKPINTLIPSGKETLSGEILSLYNFTDSYDGIEKSDPNELAISNREGSDIELALSKAFNIDVVYPKKDKDEELTYSEISKAEREAKQRLFWTSVKYLNNIKKPLEKVSISNVTIKNFRLGDRGFLIYKDKMYLLEVSKVTRDIKNEGTIKDIDLNNLMTM